MKNHSKTCFIKQTTAIVILTLVCLSVPAVQATAAVRQTLGDLPIEGRYAISASIGHDRAEYHGRMTGGTIEADNTGNTFTARFGQTGVEMGTGSSSFSLRPAAWGYGDDLSLLLPGVPQAVENLVSYNRVTLQEWYVNGPLGLQQGFTVIEKPRAGLGPLTIAMALVGVKAGTVDADGRGMMLRKLDGGVQYRYSGLVVRDASGREADAWMAAKADTLQICVDDVGLTYPLYIDPVIQTAKLTASDGAAGDGFGSSVAMSGDTVVVGAVYDDIGTNENQGSAYVFIKPAGGWSTTSSYTAKLTASDGAAGDGFGSSVAMSGDTVAVGAYTDVIGANANQGSVYVFSKPAGGWADMTQTAKLTSSDGAASDFFGFSVAMSGDTVVVGADGKNSHQGAAYLFVKPESGWTNMTQTAKLTASDGATGDYFGTSVAISSDTVVVGAFLADISGISGQGAAYIFMKPESGWINMTQKAKLTASDGAAYDGFGSSVAISGDMIVVGANLAGTSNQGVAYIFMKPTGGWWITTASYTARLMASDGATGDYFGTSVAISGDTVVVGAYWADINGRLNQGAAYVFMKPESGWTNMTQTDKLTALYGAADDSFGFSLSISGYTVVVGAFVTAIGGNIQQGAVYVFKYISEEPKEQAANVVFPFITNDSMTIGWTPGTGMGSIVLMKQGGSVDTNPADFFDYTANSAFGSGAQIGIGNYVVYSGSSDTVTVTGLSPATDYHVAVYDYSSSPPSESVNYRQTRPATGSQTTTRFKRCPAVKIYGEESPESELLRRYRDEVLEQTAAGGLVVRLYYKLSPMAEKMIDNSPYLRQTTKRIIDMLLPSIKRRLER